ncbi:GNAT family N-acetyltransferase [Pseudomonas viridiflava]|nr:GNAT family N-acetyltransferase [Pseudomonas viridiflava]
MKSLKIRHAFRSDAQAAFDIRYQAIRHQCKAVYSASQITDWTDVPLTDKYRTWVENDYHVAIVDGAPVATGLINFQTGELEALFVLPAFMGQGIGKRMLVYLEKLAREAGLTEVYLEATLNAEGFYQRCGFIGSAQAVYESPSGLKLACVPMRKQLV